MTTAGGRHGRRRLGERGAVTAEFAVALPIVVTVLAGALAAVVLVDEHGRLLSAAGAAARAVARGDDAAAARAVGAIAPDASTSTTRSDGLVCVVVRRASSGPIPIPIAASASSCAADGGR